MSIAPPCRQRFPGSHDVLDVSMDGPPVHPVLTKAGPRPFLGVCGFAEKTPTMPMDALIRSLEWRGNLPPTHVVSPSASLTNAHDPTPSRRQSSPTSVKTEIPRLSLPGTSGHTAAHQTVPQPTSPPPPGWVGGGVSQASAPAPCSARAPWRRR